MGLLVTEGAVALRFRRLLEGLALPLVPLGRAPGLGSAPPAPRGLLGAVVSTRPGPCGLCPDHVEEGLVK